MKIAVTAMGRTVNDRVDPRFGRCPFYVIVDTRTMKTEAVENTGRNLAGGAGVRSFARHGILQYREQRS